jgi:Protein of unknown function (DUF3761)
VRNAVAAAATFAVLIVGAASASATTPAAHPSATSAPTHAFGLECKSGYYKNVSGHCIRRPSHDPKGATAKCRDGTYSYSEHASGTCSHHGGVARWIHHP